MNDNKERKRETESRGIKQNQIAKKILEIDKRILE